MGRAGPLAGLDAAAERGFSRWTDPGGAGLAAAVAVGGEVEWQAAAGSAVLPGGPAMSADSICYTGSVAKQFTGAATLLAVRDHGVSLSDPVRRWIPELPDYAATVTIDHLLHHTSGLRDYFGYRSLTGRLPDASYDDATLLADLGRQQRLNFAPGERHLYSNTGYVLLTIVVARATGMAFADFARQGLFDPLGMSDSEFRVGTRPAGPRVARAYAKDGDGWREEDPLLGVAGDGGMRSTAADLARWAASLGGHSPALDPGLVEALTTPGWLRNGHRLTYCAGIAEGVVAGHRCFQHGGGLGAWRSALLWFPEPDVAVAITANAGDVDPQRIALAIASAALGVDRPAAHSAEGERVAEGWHGVWIDDTLGLVIEIARADDRDVLRVWGADQPIQPDGEDLVTASGSLRLARDGGTIEVTQAGAPWATLTRAAPVDAHHGVDVTALAGAYRPREFDGDWDLSADDDALLVAQLPDDRFVHTAPGVFTSGPLTLDLRSANYRTATTDQAPSMVVHIPRTHGIAFDRVT